MEPIMIISRETGLAPKRVAAAMQLLDAGATIPFIARYRKEITDSLDEVELAAIRNRLAALTELSERKQGILKSLRERDLLNPELEKRITEALDKPELEDLYEKYRPKKKTRAQAARENGLAPLALFLLRREESDPLNEARKYLSGSRGNVGSVEEALAGARDIIAEQINEDEKVRAGLRRLFQRQAVITADVIPGKEESGCKFKDYFSWRENAAGVAAHRLLAMFRGRDEGVLKVRILPDEDSALRLMEKNYLKNRGPAAAEIERAIKDAWKRLLSRSLENEFAGELKKRADTTAIAIFAKNLRLLLLSPPLGRKRVLALDPGFRSGCKVVCLDEQGKLLQHDLIFLHQEDKAAATLKKLVKKYQIEALAIGNGTAGRETETFVRNLKFEENPVIVMVDESGASIYSASECARREFPDHDLTVRGAVSIGRRLIDPLAELVKLDPQSIGVGQYQHDVDQKALQKALDDVVVSCVNQVGVELNTASAELLARVSGLNPTLAANLVAWREQQGPLSSRRELKKVPRLGPRAFELAAGFLRIRGALNPLDNSGIHPEAYPVVEKMAADLGLGVRQLMHDPAAIARINPDRYLSKEIGLPTLHDILRELATPGRDPRESLQSFSFAENVHTINDLTPGLKLPGVITNVTAFGAFVDVGVHQDGLIHISQLADRFIRDPGEVVAVRDLVEVTVLEVDLFRKRISLSLKKQPPVQRVRP